MTDQRPEVRDAYHNNIRSDVLQLVPQEGMTTVLDIGGGIGTSAAHLKRSGKVQRAVVVDLVAGDCLPEIDKGYSGNLEDPAVLDLIHQEQGTFDVILCLDVLEHLADPWTIIERCHAMLNPGGIIVASIPNIRNHRVTFPLFFRGRFELADYGLLDRTHLRWFVKKTAIELMTTSGLLLDHVEGRYLGWKNRLIDRASFGLLAEFLYVQYYIRVRRPKADEGSSQY